MHQLWIVIFLVIVSQANKRQRSRGMGPRIKVDDLSFIGLVNKAKSDVIYQPKRWIVDGVYVSKIEDYYYFCATTKVLKFDENINVMQCNGIIL
jgi:hypothetical protein